MTYILKNLGRLDNTFNSEILIDLLNNSNPKIRYWSIKNLGKLKDQNLIDKFYSIAKHDESTEVRREAVSSIGRLRDQQIKKYLKDFLSDSDPKVIVQAIRGLLNFKNDDEVKTSLKKLVDHENEIIRDVIKKEFFSNNNTNDYEHHTEVNNILENVVVKGDVRDILNLIPDNSFHLTFTSPPYYNARDYSIYESYEKYLDFLKQVFSLTYGKTKEGRFLIVNTSPVIMPRVSRQHSSKRYPIPFDLHNELDDIGWEFIDDIIWVKPEASVKNRTSGFNQHRKPLAYKPNAITEYIMVYRKKSNKLIDWNIKQYNYETIEKSKVKGDYETNNVWKIDPSFDKVHSAVFPVELCKRVIQYYSFEGDLVFDPFAGSGTFGRTSKALNRKFFLTEIKDEYFKYMQSLKKDNAIFKNSETKFYDFIEFKNKVNQNDSY